MTRMIVALLAGALLMAGCGAEDDGVVTSETPDGMLLQVETMAGTGQACLDGSTCGNGKYCVDGTCSRCPISCPDGTHCYHWEVRKRCDGRCEGWACR